MNPMATTDQRLSASMIAGKPALVLKSTNAEHDPQGRIAAVHYYDPDKNSSRVIGRVFILAANGIESPKLLLLS